MRFGIIVSSAILTGAWLSAGASAQSVRDRLAGAVEAIQSNCAEDVDNLCPRVTPGEGRILLCMQAHEDRLSRGCQIALYRASRGLENALDRVQRIADACWNDIQAQCGDAGGIGQCLIQKRQQLSDSCQAAVGAVRNVLGALPIVKGLPAYAADNQSLGNVVDVVRGPDGKIQSVQIEVGRFLGIGSRVVTISGNDLETLADRIRLRLTADAVRALPETRPMETKKP
jgi:Golgi apparatus protein 1